ncbi:MULTISPECIES: hypothetical protein [Mammaliicoccus]|uniref:hypothetical protein n=1 Tax=Mammaliicoccus TaxID=2803850 RepID=UPI001AACEF0C|nr:MULTISPECIES: hypothetical protein [Mammaliicoccus]MBO3061372.1 hypothetical protein [Mammaliicoccus fleurettii]
MKFQKKITVITSSVVLLSTLALPIASEKTNIQLGHQNKKAEAAAGWKKLTTTTGNTAGKNLTTKMGAEAILGLVGWAAGGAPGTAMAIGGFDRLSEGAFSKLKTAYYTDVIYERKTLHGPEWKHVITFYSNKSKTKKVGTANVIQKTVVKGELAKKDK